MVRDNANLVVKDFKRISETINELKTHIDKNIESSVDEINSLAHSIAKINKEVVRLENAGGETGDLRDQRDRAVRTLAEFFKVHTYEDNKGEFVVNIVGAGSLVAGGSVNELQEGKTSEKIPGSYSQEGRAEIFFKKKGNSPITASIKTGKIGALIGARNEHIFSLYPSFWQWHPRVTWGTPFFRSIFMNVGVCWEWMPHAFGSHFWQYFSFDSPGFKCAGMRRRCLWPGVAQCAALAHLRLFLILTQ